MAEETRFFKSSGTVVHHSKIKTVGKDIKYQKQIGGFTIENPREYKDRRTGETKKAYDRVTFEVEGEWMSKIPNIGDRVTVDWVLNNSFWKEGDAYFNKLKPTKIEVIEYAPKSKQPAPVRQDDVSFLDANQPDDIDPLPF
jgi:hypothetical protein